VLSEICLQCFDAVVGRQEGHPALRVVGCWCGYLSGAKCRQLYDLHINSMTYALFFISDYQFQKVFYVSLGNNFLLFFCGGPAKQARRHYIYTVDQKRQTINSWPQLCQILTDFQNFAVEGSLTNLYLSGLIKIAYVATLL